MLIGKHLCTLLSSMLLRILYRIYRNRTLIRNCLHIWRKRKFIDKTAVRYARTIADIITQAVMSNSHPIKVKSATSLIYPIVMILSQRLIMNWFRSCNPPFQRHSYMCLSLNYIMLSQVMHAQSTSFLLFFDHPPRRVVLCMYLCVFSVLNFLPSALFLSVIIKNHNLQKHLKHCSYLTISTQVTFMHALSEQVMKYLAHVYRCNGKNSW